MFYIIILYIILVIVESSLLLISNFIGIPQCFSILLGILIGLLYIFISSKSSISSCVRRVIASIAIASVLWSVFSAYALPYWNSVTIRIMMGEPYPATKSADYLLSAKQAQEDFSFAMRCLEKVHPAILEDNRSKDIIRLSNLEFADDSISVSLLYRQLQTIAASFHDAHTEVFPVWSYRHWIDYSRYGEISSIDGISKDDFDFAFGRYISSETPKWTRKRIYDSFRSYEGLKLLGLFASDTLTIGFANNNAIAYRSFTQEDFKLTKVTSSFSLTSEEYAVCKYDDSISSGYLNLANCFYYTPRQRNTFKKILKEFFLQVRNRHYRRIVIDLRNNPGGNLSLANELLRYFPVEMISMGGRYHRYGPVMIGGKKIHRNSIYKDLCFNGEVYVLTSLETFSGAMHLADYLQGNNLAKIVGESPGNLPSCYTDISHFILPNSQLSLTVSTGKFIRLDRSLLYNHIVPDIPCSADTAYKTLKEMLLISDNKKK